MLEAAAAQAIGSAVQPGAQAGKGFYGFLKHKYDYVKNLDNNFSMLQTEKRRLWAKVKDVKGMIKQNEVLMEKTCVCKTWLEEVNRINGEVSILERSYSKVKKYSVGNLERSKKNSNVRSIGEYNNFRQCLCVLRPFCRRLKLSKNIVNKTNEVVNLMNQMDLEDVIIERRTATILHTHVNKIDDVPSLYENVEILLKHLKDKSIRRIGIWGEAGVGKTTIMKNLNDEVGKTGLFDIVIFVAVSKDWSLSKVQQELVGRLKLRVEDLNTDQANIISTALEGKRYLLLLDEVFSHINLSGLGVHNSHEHGKVVVASRGRNVCNNMDVDEEIKVKRLSKSDAWKLFRALVGNAADHPRITPVAKRVLKECGELPRLIEAIGKTMKNVFNESLWWNKLTGLQSLSGSRPKDKDLEETFNAFKLVYDELTNDRKNCLLYGTLFPEDHDIYQDYLMECWSAEEFILEVKLRQARDEGHKVLEDLISVSLLERCKNVDYVKMPMLIRRMALQIILPNEVNWSVLVRSGEDVATHPPPEEWVSARRISLMCNEMQSLPDRPECCTISSLLLQRNGALTTIPYSFFAYMCGLRVLDLYKTRIESLPSSMLNLIDLRGLYLNDCSHIVELPIEIAELKKLEVLDIRGTGIRSLPTMIGELVGLKCLRVSFVDIVGNNNHVDARQMIMIPSNIIVKLSRLEELTIDVDPNKQSWNDIVDGIAKEVATLRTLTRLHFYFPTLNCFEAFINDSKSWNNNRSCKSIRSFRLLVGSQGIRHVHGLNISGNFTEGHLGYSGGEGFPAAILRVLDQVITLELIDHRKIQSLSDFGMAGVRGLKICLVRERNDMKRIINGNTITGAAFPYLEQLHVINLPKLEHIWEGPLELGSLAKLTILQLCGCPNLSNLLLVGMTKHLTKLQVLRVENCSQIENIIEADDDQFVGLSELKILELLSLPTLVSIYPNDTLSWPALEKLVITGCDRLGNLPLSTEKASKLRRIECSDNWWRALVWQSDTTSDSLRNLCYFI